MNTKLLAGASTLVLAMGLSTAAFAVDDNNANNNLPYTAVSQDESGDAAAGANNAVEDGAIATSGNALGKFSDFNAAAAHSSTAVQIDATSDVTVQPIIGTNSHLNLGDNNRPASGDASSAASTGSNSPATTTNDDVEEGSSQVIGSGNSTATAEDGGAAVGGSGTAIGINNIEIGQEGDNVKVLSSEGGEDEGEGQSLDASLNSNGFDHGGGGGDDATVAFGVNNTVASAHLKQTVSGLAIAISGNYEGEDPESATITTGSIFNNSISSATGANRIVFNTGIANQGRALSIAANSSFN